jgi:predicted translin family RNA/ssDNA-binding protein
VKWLRKRHKADVQEAEKQAAKAQEAAEETKQEWDDVNEAVRKSREMREANGWTESIISIFGGRA